MSEQTLIPYLPPSAALVEMLAAIAEQNASNQKAAGWMPCQRSEPQRVSWSERRDPATWGTELRPPPEHANKPLHWIERHVHGAVWPPDVWKWNSPRADWEGYGVCEAFGHGFRYLGPAEWRGPEAPSVGAKDEEIACLKAHAIQPALDRVVELERKLAISEEKRTDRVGPNDEPNNRANDVIGDLLNRRIAPPVRQAMRRALDVADKPPAGRDAADAGLGRAIGSGARMAIGLRG